MPRPNDLHPSTATATLVASFAAGVLLVAQAPPSPAADEVRALYTKYEYQIPMRDGVKLFTSVYVPKDASEPHPILLNRTPYSVAPYGADNYRADVGPSDLFRTAEYIVVYQDVRGRFLSEGEFVNVRPHNPSKRAGDIDESTDTYDTIDWLVKRVPDNNGRVGMWGISYPGFYAAAGMIGAHPALKAASPQAPISDWFAGDDFHHNGALFLPHAFNFFVGFGKPRPTPTTTWPPRFDHGTADGYRFFLELGSMPNATSRHMTDVAFWNDAMAHETYDAFWQARNLRPHLKAISPAVMTVGGWFDAENLFGALNVYAFTERQSPGAVNALVMGPWSHGGWSRSDGGSLGDVTFGSKTGAWYREHVELPFFEHHLKGRSSPELPEATVFETGTNVWRRHAAWPPEKAAPRTLYLHGNGRLSFDQPTESASEAFDEYISDPARPVPFIANIAVGMTREYMVDDQRFATRRPDVLVYQTDVLAEDLTIAGPVMPELTVSTSGTDSDWIVKLVDVYPDSYPDPDPNPKGIRMGGYQQLVRGDVMRGKFRNSLEKPEPFTPGQATKVAFTMPDVYHTFRRGHRVMVQVQSTWFPLVNRNPQKFVDINTAPDSEYQKATQRVYRSRATPSGIVLNVLQ